MRQKPKTRSGFTLIEVMITLAIGLILTIFLVQTFSQSKSAMDLGTAKTSMQQATRIAIDRMTPLVVSAAPIGGVDAIIRPAIGATDDRILFNTTEDFLDPAYNLMDPFNYGSASAHTYAITHDAANRALILQKWDLTTDTADASVDPRRLAKEITGFETFGLFSNSVEVRVTATEAVRDATRRTEDKSFTMTTVLQVPTLSAL
ncbi:MAG: prepilin-type N-terminal cleavage/methylation domain-containing protein [Bdellovibrionales bacterium]|nr:prepilin-type N-terminal cleavage/methylation domain-containing protein [Bdellovibrionales bacterium]